MVPFLKTNVIEWQMPKQTENAFAKALRNEMMLWVYPFEDLRTGSYVIVNEYELAIFMKDGKIYDILPPGRHLISTQNIPLLTTAFNIVGGYLQTPFKAKIIFLSTKQFTSKFSAKTMVKLGPQINFPTEVQTSGEFWYRIADPPMFLTQIAGSLGSTSSGDVSNFIRSFFLEQFLQELSKYSGIDVYSHLEETSSKIKTSNIIEGFKQRGLELIDLKISSLTMPFFDELMKDPTYGLPLHIALQSGDMNKVMDMVKTVESMRALGKSGGASTVGALFAVPQMLGAPQYAPPQYPPQYAQQSYPQQYAQQPAPQQQPQFSPPPQPQGESVSKSPLEKLRELKQMFDEGFITQDEYDKTKNEILSQMKK